MLTVVLAKAADAVMMGEATDAVMMGEAADAVMVGEAADAVTLGKAADAVMMGEAAAAVMLGKAADAVMLGKAADAMMMAEAVAAVMVATSAGLAKAVELSLVELSLVELRRASILALIIDAKSLLRSLDLRRAVSSSVLALALALRSEAIDSLSLLRSMIVLNLRSMTSEASLGKSYLGLAMADTEAARRDSTTSRSILAEAV